MMLIPLKQDIEMKRCGFTLIELLVVIVILSILATLGSKGLRSARLTAKKTQARVEMQAIETAIKSYLNIYGKLPVKAVDQGKADPGPDDAFSLEIIKILTGVNSNANPRLLVFLDPQSASTTAANNTYLDPWGSSYQVLLDTDYSGTFDYAGETIRRKAGMVSSGLHTLTGASADVLKSWE
jgi:prepilin-type N-terminal cleavage/methylation domain-containing protein